MVRRVPRARVRICRSATSTSCTTIPVSRGRSAARCSQGKPPVVHTLHGPWTDQNRAALRARSRSTCTSSRSATRNARGNLDVPYAGTVHNGIDLAVVQVPRRQGTLRSSTSGAPIPTRDPTEAITIARRAGLPLLMLAEARRAARAARTSTARSSRCSAPTSSCSRTSRTKRRSSCSAARARWCSRSAGPSRSAS